MGDTLPSSARSWELTPPESARSWMTPPPESARSKSSIHSFNTPRDDRFFSPRTLNSGSQSDDWITPRENSSKDGRDSKATYFGNDSRGGGSDEKLADYRLYTEHKQSLNNYGHNSNDADSNRTRGISDFVMDMSKALPKSSSLRDNYNNNNNSSGVTSASFMLDDGYGIDDDRQLHHTSMNTAGAFIDNNDMLSRSKNRYRASYKDDFSPQSYEFDGDLGLNHVDIGNSNGMGEEDIDEAVASGMVDGISEQDVEDIFAPVLHSAHRGCE